jgi:hypothetical protein
MLKRVLTLLALYAAIFVLLVLAAFLLLPPAVAAMQ